MAKEYFPFTGKIPFEGKESKNVMAFHYYDPEKVVMGKKMKDWLKFAMAWWHTLGGASADQFGGQTRSYEWDKAEDAVQRAKDKMDAGFEFMDKLGIEYYYFHDIDLDEEGDTIEEYEARMKAITDYAQEKMKQFPNTCSATSAMPTVLPPTPTSTWWHVPSCRLRTLSTLPSNSAAPITCSGADARAT